MKKVTPKEIIQLIKELPDADNHIFDWKEFKCITNEWLVGGFAGRSFDAYSLETAAQQLIEYLYEHIGHDSIVGMAVTESGFPNLDKVKKYCLSFEPKQDEE